MTKGVALVTGAAQRIGKAIALDLASKGWNIAVHYNASKTKALDLVQDIKSKGQNAIALQADLSKEFDAPKIFEQIKSELGKPISLLINNAALFENDNISTLNQKSFLDHQTTNLFGPILLCQAFAAQLIEGNIINMVDQRVIYPKPEFLSYTLSKSSLLAFTKILAQEIAPKVRVNAIGPGPVLKSIHQTEDDFQFERKTLPLKTGPSLGDLNRAISFILETPSMTGQFILLDGGQHLL